MQGSIDKTGTCVLRWNIQETKLLSPDGMQQCLPCEGCGQPQWVSLQTCSVLCVLCALAADGDPLENAAGYREHVYEHGCAIERARGE